MPLGLGVKTEMYTRKSDRAAGIGLAGPEIWRKKEVDLSGFKFKLSCYSSLRSKEKLLNNYRKRTFMFCAGSLLNVASHFYSSIYCPWVIESEELLDDVHERHYRCLLRHPLPHFDEMVKRLVRVFVVRARICISITTTSCETELAGGVRLFVWQL